MTVSAAGAGLVPGHPREANSHKECGGLVLVEAPPGFGGVIKGR